MIVLEEPKIIVHSNVTPRTIARALAPSLDCRTCLFQVERSCTSNDECESGSLHTPTMPLRLWRGA